MPSEMTEAIERDEVGAKLLELGLCTAYELTHEKTHIAARDRASLPSPWNLPSRLIQYPLDMTAPHGDTPRRIALRHPALAGHPLSGVLMSDRETARRWIELRHTGQNGGRGIVDWNGVQTARFRGDRTLDLIEFVKQKGNLTDAEKALISHNFPITTLDRIISNPAVRQKIGIQIVDGEYFFIYPQAEIIKILKQIVLDLAHKTIKVDAVKTAEQQVKYVDGLPKSSMPSGPKLKAAEPVSQTLKSPLPSPKPAPPTPSPLDRKTLIPASFGLAISNTKVAQLFWELKKLNIDKFPIAGACIFRSFVEAVVVIYCNDNAIKTVHTDPKNAGKAYSLSEKVEAVLKHPALGLTKQQGTAARTALTAKDSVISVQRLHEYVHNPDMFPSKNDLIGAWSGVEAFFQATCK